MYLPWKQKGMWCHGIEPWFVTLEQALSGFSVTEYILSFLTLLCIIESLLIVVSYKPTSL